jgi:hypothetical protein
MPENLIWFIDKFGLGIVQVVAIVLVGVMVVMYIGRKIDALDRKVDMLDVNVNRKVDMLEVKVDRKFDAQKADSDRRFDALDHKIDMLEVKVDRKFDAQKADSDHRFDHVDYKLDLLKTNDLAHLKEVDDAILFLLLKNKDLSEEDVAYVKRHMK